MSVSDAGIQARNVFSLFPTTTHHLKLYTKTRRGQTQKNLVIKRQPEPNQHLALFQPKRKTLTQGRANSGKGDHLQAKKVRHLKKLAGAGELSRQLPSGKHLPTYKTLSPMKAQYIYNLPSVCNIPLGIQYIFMTLPEVSS